MTDRIQVDIFVEDRAHEAFLIPLLQRIADEAGRAVQMRIRSARGGHPRAIAELKLYQKLVSKSAIGASLPDVLVVGIDGNCSTVAKKKEEIRAAMSPDFSTRLVMACPDPHVERWYLADPESFYEVVGSMPKVERKKCARDHYKNALSTAVEKGGHPVTLGGTEFAQDIVENMDLYRAGKNDHSLKAFMDDMKEKLRLTC